MSAFDAQSSPTTIGRASRASGRSPRWAAAVIATVAILAAGIGLAAGSFLLNARDARAGAAASYVPASAAMYVELRLEPSAAQDAALRDILGRFPQVEGLDLERPLYDQLGELLDDAFAAEGAAVTWRGDIATWFDGRLAIAVVELPAAAFDPTFDPMAEPEVPPMVVLAGVTDPTAAREAIGRIVEATGPRASGWTVTEHRGVTIESADGATGGAWALTDDQLLVAPTAADIVAALDARATGPTLADDDDHAALAARLPDDWLAFVSFDLTEAVAAAVDAAGPSGAAMAALIEHQPMRGAVAILATDDGLSFDAVTAAPTGPFAVDNAERGLADEVPADALYYAEGGNAGASLVAFVTSLKQGLAAEPEAAEGIRTAEAALGADLEELVAWIGDGAMVAGWDGSQPYGGLLLVPDDPAAAERRLGQLGTFARLAASEPSSGIEVSDREVAGVTVTTVRWQDPTRFALPGEEAMTFVVEYALTDDRVLVGFGDRFVARVLELDSAHSLATVAGYADAVASLGGPAGTGIGWLDLGGTLHAVEEAMGEMLGDPTYETEIRPWLLPWDRMVAVSRLDDGRHVQRAVILIR